MTFEPLYDIIESQQNERLVWKMGKYEVYVCSCGRIHLMDRSNFDWLSDNYTKRSVIIVCNNCGSAREIFLDEYMDGFALCEEEIKDKEIDIENGRESKIIASRGIRVRLKNKNEATEYYDRMWSDENYKQDEVDVQYLINSVKDEEKLKSIAGYCFGIDWSGTKYNDLEYLNS